MGKTKNKKKATLLLILAGGLCLFLFFLPLDSLTLENIKIHKEAFKETVEKHYGLSVALFVCAHLPTAFFLPGEILLVLTGGFLFGVFWGTVYVVLGITLGSSLAFLTARFLIGEWIQDNYRRQLRSINREIAHRGHSYLLSLRILPVVPLFVTNYIAGISPLRFSTFLWTTSLGILPGAVFLTYAGQQLGRINRVKDLFTMEFYLALLGLGLFVLSPVILKHVRKVREMIWGDVPP